MVEGMLSQEEIDALLSGTSFSDTSPPATRPAAKESGGGRPASTLGKEQVRTLNTKLNAAFGPAADVGSTVLSRSFSLTPLSIDSADDAKLVSAFDPDSVSFEFDLTGQLIGGAAFVLSIRDAAVFADIMMGGDGSSPPSELDDLHQSATKEFLSALANGLTSALSRELPGPVSPGLMSTRLDASISPPYAGRGDRILASYTFTIDGVHSGALHFVVEAGIATAIAGTAPQPQESVKAGSSMGAAPAGQKTGQKTVAVQAVQFPSLSPTLTDNQSKNIEILMDVPMQVTVELGRTTMMIRDVLELGTGSIIELDKLAGEPVDLLVNQKLIARGEVVVIDESFGVRVTDIVSPMERVKSLQ